MPYWPQRSSVRPGHREATDRPQVAALRGRSYAEGGAQLPADSWYCADVMLASITSLSFRAETPEGWHPPPPRCGRGLNSIQCIGVISNNTKYKKYIKSRCTLQPYSWQGISWGFLVLITPAIEIKLDLTSNLIVKRYMTSSRSLLFFAGCFYLSSFTNYCRFSTKIYILVHTDLFKINNI